jgi:hypothetical protein
MSADLDQERNRLSQAKLLEWLMRDIHMNELATVYWSDDTEEHHYGMYCGLIPTAAIEGSLSRTSWDLTHGQGLPGAVKFYENDREHVEYLRFGDRGGVEPLVIDREFYGIRPDYIELSEEFRLFHHLYHDRKLDCYYKIDDSGNEDLIATVEPNRIQVRLKEVRQFLAIKEMHLAIFFDCREHSTKSLEELKLAEGGADSRDSLSCWGCYYGDLGGITDHRAFSRLLGKRLISPLPKEKSGFWGFVEEKPKKHVAFVIGTNEHGDESTYTSNPAHLADYFGANPDAPHYLTAVNFRKQVLDKYYQLPGKYSVADSMLRCGSLWGMTMDNHHDDRVVAWLGDLGRDLPYEEQLHWRSYNISLIGGVSETFFRRQILAQPTDSDRPEHLFHQKYKKLANTCREQVGWLLLLPLSSEDEHHLRSLRVPSTDEQKDFDELVQALAKILIDSLNEKALHGLIPTDSVVEIKGSISRLESALRAKGVSGFEPHIAFLRKLQELRSSGAAHRKGDNYRKIAGEFQVDDQNLRAVFSGILARVLDVLDFLTSAAESGALRSNEDEPKLGGGL